MVEDLPVVWEIVVRAGEAPDTVSAAVDLGDDPVDIEVLEHLRALGYEIEGDADEVTSQSFVERMAALESERMAAEEQALREYFELIGYEVID